jgi:citrate synthase
LNFNNVIKWGGTIENAIASSLLTLNTVHGPFTECYELIEKYSNSSIDIVGNYVRLEMENGRKIPGFGNPVIKGRDSRCLEISQKISKISNSYCLLSEFIEREIYLRKDIDIYSNLAFWSAAGAHAIGLPKSHASLIPILSFVCRYVNSV